MSAPKALVRQLVRESQNILATSRDPKELCCALEGIRAFLPSASIGDSDTNTHQREEFLNCHYPRFLNVLVGHLSLDWCGRFTTDDRQRLVDVFFLDGIHHHALLALCNAISHSSPSFKQNQCLSLLEKFLHRGRMSDLLWTQSVDVPTLPNDSRQYGALWERLLTTIVSLPDRIANKLQDKCSPSFGPKQFFTNLASDVMNVLQRVCDRLRANQDCSLQFVSRLIGRICLNGHAETLFCVLLPHLTRLTVDDYIWRRICLRIIIGSPDRCLESIMACLITKIRWYGVLTRLLGDSILDNDKLEYLLTNKLLLLRCFKQDLVPQNILGYLAHSPSRRHLFIKTLQVLLDVWGDSSAVKHTSYDQQVYITKGILICLGHVNDQEKTRHRSVLTQKLMAGMECHLHSPLPRVRRLGMITAEAVTQCLQTDGKDPKLTFEYEVDEETRGLWALLVCPEDPGVEEITTDVKDISINHATSTVVESTSDKPERREASGHVDSDLDSDDDLEPYDMSEDVKKTEVRTPLYIKDCIEGLLAKENRELIEVCLRSAERLVRSKPDNLDEVCVDVVRILLHLENTFSIDEFTLLRHTAMVATAVHCPITIAEYLTGEFYDRNYNIRQRLDMLEVLAAAAQEMSQPIEEPTPPHSLLKPRRPMTSAEGSTSSQEAEQWRDIVQRRIDSKTRRFGKGRTTAIPTPVANRFAPVAGYFFFPLLRRYDSKLNTMDMIGEDFLLLGRMLYTLGVVVHAAQHAPICRQMAVTLLELVWVLRYHSEVFVRQALLFAISMVTLSVPSHLLVSDLQDEMLECKLWLEDIVKSDPSIECKSLATQTLMILGSVVKKELKSRSSDPS